MRRRRAVHVPFAAVGAALAIVWWGDLPSAIPLNAFGRSGDEPLLQPAHIACAKLLRASPGRAVCRTTPCSGGSRRSSARRSFRTDVPPPPSWDAIEAIVVERAQDEARWRTSYRPPVAVSSIAGTERHPGAISTIDVDTRQGTERRHARFTIDEREPAIREAELSRR